VHAAVAQLAINRLTVIPFSIHPVLQIRLVRKRGDTALLALCPSFSVVVNYNGHSQANSFFLFLRRRL
jgi:hypothetical protein